MNSANTSNSTSDIDNNNQHLDPVNRHLYNSFINMTSRSPTQSHTNNTIDNNQIRLQMEMDTDMDMDLDMDLGVNSSIADMNNMEIGNRAKNLADYTKTKEPLSKEQLLFIQGIQRLEADGLIDIGNLAAWDVSSSKPGCEVNQLRDESPNTFWQSDGQQPHYLMVRFTKSVDIERISLFLNYSVDESYTPEKISVFAGTGEHDLVEVTKRDFFEPVGWQHIVFDDVSSSGFLKCYLVKIKFLSNHQNGKDCHVRGVKIMSPIAEHSITSSADDDEIDAACVGFTSNKFISESVIR